MNDANKVTVGKPKIGGSLYVAPLGTAVPTDATTQLGNDFVCLGYVSEDGVTNSISRTVEDIKAWGGDVVHSSQTEKTDDFKFVLIEALNENVLRAYFGDDNVTGDLSTGMVINVNLNELENKAWVFEMILNNSVLKRIVVPSAKVVECEEVTYKDNEPVGYGMTIRPVTVNGYTHHEYLKSVPSNA